MLNHYCLLTRQRPKKEFFYNGNEASRPAPPPPRFARCASSSGPPPPLRVGGKGKAFSRRVRARAVLTRPDCGQRQETNGSPKRRERSAGRRWVDSAPRSRRRRLLRFGRGIPPPHLSRGGGRCGGGRASRRSTAAPSFCSAPPLLPLSGSSRETPVAAQGFGHVVSAGAVVNGIVTAPVTIFSHLPLEGEGR